MRLFSVTGLFLLVLSVAPAAADRGAPLFQWDGRLQSGQTLEIENINGPISVERAAGDHVSVTALRTAENSDPNSVRIQVDRDSHGVLLCAVYPNDGPADQTCRHNGGRNYHDHDSGNNDTRVAFSVRLPAGIAATLRAVNGSVDVDNVASPVDAASVNGHVNITTSSYAQAKTVQGNIHVTMQDPNWPSDGLEFASVNGAIDLTLPRSASARVHAKTMNGSISSAVPLNVYRGNFVMTYADGNLGSGKSRLSITTLNGNIRLANGP